MDDGGKIGQVYEIMEIWKYVNEKTNCSSE